ncbi:sensor histidine kinase [Verminephrobacter aporrectodeae]|uniref:sensor histidine kinase n=1 Tax=Verminephrobacter aporrectodeae TaxID=1110389 RepID=UPI000497D339|nr:HAMP domain-containing sensor histidine kinase [Verminephrobacter aporrectodeae]MCW5220598.1 sensor histidine kinase [Verminephrobacter aporrectodeae subsp. tuberculatae]MCW5255446.1 sensor histidine kinase [Verminephrobacter aporrectodeae subsp. tuberculatae]MCW5289893.1 sensor histidine kinase [Verminephrobacter aporrectodeae subsp. tuberculatae]MCW8174883.1 sensor histidine kinase [Verminephrobacter aporrectodeae subsp. tuberculatae]MCW8198583.1 sensor histidine kinase [Verminephrobacter
MPPESPHSAPGRTSGSHGPSFQQLLLLAFLLLAGLLGASSLRALHTLEQLMLQSRDGAAQATDLSAAAQALSQRGQALERAARQSLVLHDRPLRRSFESMSVEAQAILERLRAGALPADQARQWRRHLDAIEALLDAPPERALDNERLVAEEFVALAALHAAIVASVQDMNARRAKELQGRIEASQRNVTHQVVGAIVLALALALALGIWLARPFKRLEGAIRRLGENRLDQAVLISGPGDVRRVGQQLEWLRLRLLELDADKARFLRHVSHELKTPLAALREGVALLQDGVTGALNTGQREVTQILQHNTLVLQREIEALLRFNAAAFEARQLQRQDTDLLALLEAQVESQRLQWQAKDLRVQIEGPALSLQIDADKIAVAVGNLLSNAIRFSPQGATVRLTLSCPPGWVRLDVSDQGPGVAEDDRERVFEPFYRGLHQPGDAVRGTGIGLSIVREYVAAHGGQVRVVDAGDHSFFRMELPHA